MMDKDKQGPLTHFGGEMLQVIDDCDIFADGEVILGDLMERYESHPGFMFLCRTLPKLSWGAHYCWWLFTDEIAVHFACEDDSKTLHFWGAPVEARRIRSLVGEWCPF